MNTFKTFFAGVIALLLIVDSAFSQASGNSPAKSVSGAPEKLVTVEGITEYKLSNGLRVLLFPDPSKESITVNVTYLVGSRMEGYGETGMAHLLEHMVFKGSTNHTNIPNELTSHGCSPNGSTNYDRTNYFETFSATGENLQWALDMESDRMVNSFIAKKDLETEFSVVRNEFEAGENYPSNVLLERVMSSAYLWHNYGKSVIGSKEDIERVPIDNLKTFYKKYYQPDNAVLTIAGKINTDKTLELVNKYFGQIAKPKRKIEEPYTVEPVQDGERETVLKRVGDMQAVSCGYHIPCGSHADFPAIEVLAEVLTNEPSGRLYKALVESKKATGQWGFPYSLKDPGFVYFNADVLKEKSISEARAAMMTVMDEFSSKPVTQEEVERAKNKLLKDIDLALNNSGRVGITLSEYIAKGDWRLFFIHRDGIEKVTSDDVNRVAKAYFKPSNRTVGLFIPDSNPDRADIPSPPDLSSLTKDYKGRNALAEVETFDSSPGNIDRKTKIGKIDGGAQYALLSKPTRGDNVNVNINLQIGTEKTLVNKATVANLTASMLNRGSRTKTREQISDAFDKLKAQVRFWGNGQSVGASVNTTKENLTGTLKLLTEIFRQPVFPTEEFDKLKDEELAGIDQQRSDPQSIAFNTFDRISNPYPQGDYRYVMNFDEQANAMKLTKVEDLKQFYTDFYDGSNATAAIVGNFDEDAALLELKLMFTNWKGTYKYERAPERFFEVAGNSEKINTPDKKNAALAAGMNLKLKDDDPDYAGLVLGDFMFGGGFLNSRLATRIRQKEGVSYGVGSWISGSAWEQVGWFGSYAIYNPVNADKLMTAYQEELTKMLQSGFTEAELKDAKSGYLQEQKVNRSRDRSLAYQLSNNLFLHRTMKWDDEFEKKIELLNAGQVKSAMNKFIIPGKITYIQAGDFKAKSEASGGGEKK